MAKLLTVNGLEVTAVGSGKDALEELKAKPYDVITLDIRMPGMSGLEALAEIKKVNPGIEVIILTGHASVDTAVEIMKLGGYEYLLKPTSTEELMNKIDSAYERKLTREQKTRKGDAS
jgi:DNA-binding NtrC family response regulator